MYNGYINTQPANMTNPAKFIEHIKTLKALGADETLPLAQRIFYLADLFFFLGQDRHEAAKAVRQIQDLADKKRQPVVLSKLTDQQLESQLEQITAHLASLSQEKERRRVESTRKVTVHKVAEGHFTFTHPTAGEFVAKRVAHAGRYRVWQLVRGARGLKLGPVIMKESYLGIQGIRAYLAQNY